MKFRTTIGICLGLSISAIAQEGFESPAYVVGQTVESSGLISGTNWVISDEQSASGEQSLKVEHGGSGALEVSHSSGVRFIDLYVLPTFEEDSKIRFGQAEISFSRESGKGRLILIDGNESVVPGLESQELQTVGSDGLAENWIRITLRVEGTTTDLYIDGRPVAARVPLGQPMDKLTVWVGSDGVFFIDSFLDTTDNPLFPDGDRDGMPDAEEKALGLNPFADDRMGDLDSNGISNIEDFFAGRWTQGLGGLGSSVNILYVDNRNGNDANSGQRSYSASGNQGPKASIKQAMAACEDGSVIIVLKGTGIYQEGSRSAEGKQITVRAVDSVQIR